jgi:autotransporter-associated beta strand protein
MTSGTVTVSLPTGVPSVGEVPLIKYSGTIGGSGFGAFALQSLPPGVTAVLTNDTVNGVVGLLVQNVSSLTWIGINGTAWDIGITTNWSYLGNNLAFSQGSGAILDDTALTNQLNLTTTASLFNMLVTNNILDYTISGNGALSGQMTLTKAGTGTLTLNNLGTSTYTGGMRIHGGTLDVRGNNCLGSGTITLAGGTLENNSATTLTINNAVYAQSNTTSTFQGTGGADPQLVVSGNLTGSGTVAVVLQGSSLGGIGLSGDNSGFTGTFATSNNTSLRFNFNTASAGSANANWVLNSTGTDNQRISFGNGTISFGSLSGTGNCRQDVPNTLSILRIGDLNTNSSWGGTLNQGNGTQRIGILKVGTGTWTITASQPYTGPTTISNGVLALANDPVTSVDGAIPNTPNIYIASGAALDVSGRSDQNISLGLAQVLSGNGTIYGNVDNNGGGTIAPGDGLTGNVGVLTIANTLAQNGTTWMKLNRVSVPNSDRLVATNISCGGTLVVTNVGPTLKAGDTFRLFSSANPPTGAFTLVLPNYYVWDTSNLNVNGTISVVRYSPPVISSVDFSTLSSGTITVNATNGVSGGPVNVMTSTNISLPLGSWTPVTTNSFDGNGNYSEAVTLSPGSPRQFFILKTQ